MQTKSYILVAAAAATTLLLQGCGGSSSEKTHASAPEAQKPPLSVKLETIALSEWPSVYEATGTVRARTAAQISSRMMGYVREVRVKTGDHVREGQVLVVLDSRDVDVRKRQTEAAQLEARSAAVEADQGIATARANLELSEITFNRMKDLFDKKSLSRQEFDEAAARLKTARSAVEMALARRAQINARIAQAEEETRGVAVQQGYATVTAPFAGVITDKTVEAGNLAVPGAPLMTLERAGDYRLEVSVEESRLHDIRPGIRVPVKIDAIEGELSGPVTELVPAVDAASRSGIVKIDLPASPQLRSGLFGRARFAAGSSRALLAPATAIAERGQVQWVFVAENGVAHARIVTTGERREGRAEILSGLAAGERIVTNVPPALTDGARIEVQP